MGADATVTPRALSKSSVACLLENGSLGQGHSEVSRSLFGRDLFLVARIPIFLDFRVVQLRVTVLISLSDPEYSSEGSVS